MKSRKTPVTIDQKCFSFDETVIGAERGQNPSIPDMLAWFSAEKDFMTRRFDENCWTQDRICSEKLIKSQQQCRKKKKKNGGAAAEC